MNSNKIMIVDDSPFSRAVIGQTLQEAGFEIVGEAESIDTLIETYDTCKPDVITMDLVMPGADGFECSRALLRHDKNAKIILVSSMKDEDTVAEAKSIGIVGYVQKPVDGEVLGKIIHNIMSPDSLYLQLQESGLDIFNEALSQNFIRMTKSPIILGAIDISGQNFTSQGITAIIGIIGKHSGSMIMDLSFETAEKCVSSLLNRPSKNREETLAMVAELANIIAGVGCSMLNKNEKAFGLRVSPPSIFASSSSAEIASPNLKLHSSFVETAFGPIFLGVGFSKGSILWM